MTLRNFLDDIRFGNVARLCVAVCGKNDFLENYEQGMYWELKAGNWDAGSASKATPIIPEDIMGAKVMEVDASPNLRAVYSNLGKLGQKSLDTTIVLVAAYGFDAKTYWSENRLNKPPVMMDENYGHEWAYHISQEKYEEIEEMDDYSMVATAVGYLPYIGLEAIKNYSEDDFENMAEDEEHICRLAQKIAMKISNLKEMLSLIELMQGISAYKKRM